jgi:hypothetical protein
MKTGIAVVVSLLAACAASAGVPNDLLYIQNPAPGPAFISSTGPGGDFTFDDRRRADTLAPEFGLPLPARVYRIDWWGGDESNFPATPLENIASFNIRAYSDFPPSAPATVIFDQTVDITELTITATGNTVGILGAPEFRFSFESDTQLFGANAYWISIAANYINAPGFTSESFQWSGSIEGDALIAQDTFDGAGFQVVSLARTSAAYALYGAIPTPGAASLLALAGIAASRRRR